MEIFKNIGLSGNLSDLVKCDVGVLFRDQLVLGTICQWPVVLMLVVFMVNCLSVDCWLLSEMIGK